MVEYERRELYYRLGRMYDEGVFSRASMVVCFGFNYFAKCIVAFLLGAGVEQSKIRIVDNYVTDSVYKGVNVQRPDVVLEPFDADAVILLASSYNKAMAKQLKKLGYRRKRQIFEILNNASKLYKLGSRIKVTHPDRYNKILRNMIFPIYKHTHADLYQKMQRNGKFKDIHKGERCFIMGNGPSLKEVDFSLLENEIVFGVNHIMKVPGWEKAKINYWTCTDGEYLGIWTNAIYTFWEEIQKLQGKGISCFIPFEAEHYCKLHKLDEVLDLNYINAQEQYTSIDQTMRIRDIDITRFMMQGFNVVLTSINIAIYMGFSEIYLLGCNQSNLKSELLYYLDHQAIDSHAFESNNNEASAILESKVNTQGILYGIKIEVIQIIQFGMLYDYCKRKGIKLVNLSCPTLIENVPQDTLENVLGGWKNEV